MFQIKRGIDFLPISPEKLFVNIFTRLMPPSDNSSSESDLFRQTASTLVSRLFVSPDFALGFKIVCKKFGYFSFKLHFFIIKGVFKFDRKSM